MNKLTLFVLVLISFSFAGFKEKADRLRSDVQSFQKPEGFGFFKKKERKASVDTTIIKEVIHTDTISLGSLGIAGHGTGGGGSSYGSGIGSASIHGYGSGTSQYLTLREYDKDTKVLEVRIEEIETNQDKILEIMASQQQNNKDVADNQDFIIKLIESITALLGAVGAIFGVYFTFKKIKK
jgi:hypothetical protein